MQKFEGISFIWALILMGVLALIFGLRAFVAWMAVRRDAQADYDNARDFAGYANCAEGV